MGATKKAGATAPAVVINGHDIHVDTAKASTWGAFRHLRILNDEDADGVAKLDAALGYAALVSDLDPDAIAEIAGGDTAQMADVIGVAAQIIAAATPKN